MLAHAVSLRLVTFVTASRLCQVDRFFTFKMDMKNTKLLWVCFSMNGIHLQSRGNSSRFNTYIAVIINRFPRKVICWKSIDGILLNLGQIKKFQLIGINLMQVYICFGVLNENYSD